MELQPLRDETIKAINQQIRNLEAEVERYSLTIVYLHQAINELKDAREKIVMLNEGRIADLGNMEIKDAASCVLRINGNIPMHCFDIARQAQLRGYRSSRSVPGKRVNPASFRTILDRERDMFENVGNGTYRLREKLGEKEPAGQVQQEIPPVPVSETAEKT
jgi:hypothetical protein